MYWASFSLFYEFLWNITGLQHIELDERVSVGLNGNLYFSNAIETDSRRDYCCFAAFPRIRTIVQKTAMSVVVKSSTLKYSFLRVWLHNMIISLHDQHQLQTCRSCLSDTSPSFSYSQSPSTCWTSANQLRRYWCFPYCHNTSCEDLFVYFMSILSIVLAVFAFATHILFVSISSSKTS